jgi:hypothetical protein
VINPDHRVPDPSDWLTEVVEPVARRVEQAGAGLGLSSAHVPAPPAGPGLFVRGVLARGVGVGALVLKLVSAVAGDLVQIVTLGARSRASDANPVALALGSAAPGTTVRAKLLITNDTDGPFNAVQPVSRGLVATRGGGIAASAIKFAPAVVDVPAGSSSVVTMEVSVSSRTRAGGYSGLVEVAGQPGVWIVVTLDVL